MDTDHRPDVRASGEGVVRVRAGRWGGIYRERVQSIHTENRFRFLTYLHRLSRIP